MSQPTSPLTNRKNLICKVLMLDDTVDIFYVPTKSLGGILFTKVIQKLQLLEADYFDLQYRNVEGILCWLDHEKPITSHLPQNSLNFEFVVKFYTPDPGMLEEELTRYLFALQVKRDLSTGQMPCQEQTAALLASYIVQAEFGDLTDEGYENNPNYLKSFKFFPNINQDIETRIIQHHREHFGQTPMDADYNLLDTARKVEFYGICMHDAKDHDGVTLHLAVTHMGVVVFQNMTRINTFSWAKIRKLSFKRKKFLIKLHPEGYGFYKDTVEFYFSSRNECKNFWKKCLEHHAFFRCQSVKKIPRNKTRVVSHGSSFRYSGKTQKQLVDFVRENFSKRPSTFLRSTSMRTVNFGCGITSRTGTLRSLRHSNQHQRDSSEFEEKLNLQNSPANDGHKSSMIFQHTRTDGSSDKSVKTITHTLPKESKSYSTDENEKDQAMSKKDELVPKIRTKGTVDDFHFSYFTCINSSETSGETSKHQDRKSHQDNASQDSYHLHESRGSLDLDSRTPNSFYELDSRMRVVDAEMHHFESSITKSHHHHPDVILRGKSLAELSFLTSRIVDLNTTENIDERRSKFSKVRPATISYDLSFDLDAQTKVGQSCTTDVDSLSLLEEPIIEKFREVNEHVKTSKHINLDQNDEKSGSFLATGDDEECITVIDNKEDGIQYILHRRHMHSKDKEFSDLGSRNQKLICSSKYLRHKTDMEKVRTVLNNLTSTQTNSNEVFQGRLKAVDYIMYKKLPQRDSFSFKDDSIESSLFPKESHNIWRKVKDEKTLNVIKKTTCDYFKKSMALEETDFPIIEDNSERKSHKIIEYDADKFLNNDDSITSDEVQISTKMTCSLKQDCNISYSLPSSENIKQYCYRNNIKMLPYCELLKMENLNLSYDATYKRRQCFRTTERLPNLTKISSSYKTGFATGSSSFSVNEELEDGFKLDSIICCSRAVTSSKNGISSCGSQYDAYANIDKHGHVMEWLEEQQTIFKPYSFFHEINKSCFVGSRQPYSDLIRNSGNYSPSHHFSATYKETSSLPGSVPPEFFDLKKCIEPIQAQSSFGTQSFPEPLIDISSDDAEEDKNEEDFYDVNRILDYVATSNQFTMRDELRRHDFGEFSDVEELINEREVKEEIKSKISMGKNNNCSYDSQDNSLINEKVINPDVWHKAQSKVFVKSISLASTHEEEHISDILDALEGYEVTEDPVNYSDIEAESWDCLDSDSKLLTESLVCLEQVDLSNLKGLREDLKTQIKQLENISVEEPQLLETSLLPNETEIFTSYSEEMSMKNSDCRVSKSKHDVILRYCDKDIKFPTEFVNPSSLNIKMSCKSASIDTKDSIAFIAEPVVLLEEESWNEHAISSYNENYLQVIKPEGIKSDEFIRVCDALNEEFTVMSVEIGMEVMENIEMAFEETCPKVKKMKPKPKRVPDKFELFLAGVKVNLENILARDPACENTKAEITHGWYHARISQYERAFFNLHEEALLLASCENVNNMSNVSKNSIMKLHSRTLGLGDVKAINFKLSENYFLQTILECPFCDNVKKEIRRGRSIMRVFMV